MRGAAAAFVCHGGGLAPLISRRGTAPVVVPPPSGAYLTGKAALGAYHDAAQFDSWLGRNVACKSFYAGPGWPPSYSYEPTNSSRDSNWQARTYFMVNEPVPAGYSSATDRNRARASGADDTNIRQAAEACAAVIANNANYKYVIWAFNEYQCWWNVMDGGGDVAAWKAGARRVYQIGKAVLGNSLIVALCPSHNWPPNIGASGGRSCPVRWVDWYPGDDACDAVGMTLYSTWRPTNSEFNLYGSTWKDQLLDARNDWGPEGMFKFAEDHGKWFFISEYGPMYGIGQTSFSQEYDLEQADFFQFSFDRWLSKDRCVGTIFFNEMSGDGGHKIEWPTLDDARAKFLQLWT